MFNLAFNPNLIAGNLGDLRLSLLADTEEETFVFIIIAQLFVRESNHLFDETLFMYQLNRLPHSPQLHEASTHDALDK